MKALLTLILFLLPLTVFSQGKTPIEDLFLDLPREQRITKRMELIENIRAGGDKNYRMTETIVLYALNLKDDPKHSASWYDWIHATLAAGKVGQLNYSSESLKKAEGMLKLALKKNPSHLGLQLIKLRIQNARGLESYKVKAELDKFKPKAADISFQDLTFMAELYMKVDDPNSASDIYKAMEAKAVTPQQISMSLMGRGQTAQMAGNWNDCVDAYKKSDAVYPDNQFIILPIVQCLSGARRWTEALIYGEKLQPGPEVNCILADVQIGKGIELTNSQSFKEAEEMFLKSHKCLKWESYHELTNLKLKQNKYGEAYEMMMKAAGIRAPEGKSAYLREWIHAFKGDKDTSKRILVNIVETAKVPEERIRGHYELCKYLTEQKDPAAKDAGVRAIKEATDLVKTNENNYEFLKYLSAILAMQATQLNSQLFYEQGRMVIGKLRQMNPGNDSFVQEQQSILESANYEPIKATTQNSPQPESEPTVIEVPAPVAPAKPASAPVQSVPTPAYAPPAPIQAAPNQAVPSVPVQ